MSKDLLASGKQSLRKKNDELETAAMTEILRTMSAALQNIEKEFKKYDEKSSQLVEIGSSTKDVPQDIRAIQKRLREHSSSHDLVIKDMKQKVQEDVKHNIMETMTKEIKQQVRKEIQAQVKAQVDTQIFEHIPVPLNDQLRETKKQLAEVNISLENSKSRATNASLDINSQDEPIAYLYMNDGRKSEYFPANLRSLFSYDLDSTNRLVRDYGLEEGEDVQMNIKCFLSFIGSRINLVVSPS